MGQATISNHQLFTFGPLSSMVICMLPSVSSCDCKLCSVASTSTRKRRWWGIVDSSEGMLSASDDIVLFSSQLSPWLPRRNGSFKPSRSNCLARPFYSEGFVSD